MQQPRRNNINSGLCDRYIHALSVLGVSYAQATRNAKLRSRSVISEVERYIIEPSKTLLFDVLDRGISAQWLLRGEGPVLWEELRTLQLEVKKLRKENDAGKKELLIKEGEVIGLKTAITQIKKR